MSTWHRMPSPLGELLLRADAQHLSGVFFVGAAHCPSMPAPQPSAADSAAALLARAREQIEAFLSGQCRHFDLPLSLHGTPFQRTVWQALTQIPYGATISYATLAQRLGLPSGAARAVGSANARNPLSLIVPCHRVIAASGTLAGYAGGLARKQALLTLERSALQAADQPPG